MKQMKMTRDELDRMIPGWRNDRLPVATDGPRPAGKKDPTVAYLEGTLKLVGKLLDLAGSPVRLEYRFHPSRKWRFDVAILPLKVALEIDGGGWTRGRHHRQKGREEDNKKDQEAQLLGWRVFRVSPSHVINGEAFALLERVLEEDSCKP